MFWDVTLRCFEMSQRFWKKILMTWKNVNERLSNRKDRLQNSIHKSATFKNIICYVCKDKCASIGQILEGYSILLVKKNCLKNILIKY